MALKIPVEDRVATYPGRVTLTPVSGESNTYDMVRADMPIVEGTPINKQLLDSKAYTLTEDVTVYVHPSGSDVDGTGAIDDPYATIQAAINSLPKDLGGHTATLDIAAGTYAERVSIEGFSGGKLIVGVAGRTTVVRGFNVWQSEIVEFNISNVTWASGFNGTIFYVGYGSKVVLGSGMTVRCAGSTEVGVGVTYGSTLISANTTITVLNCERTAILCTYGSLAALSTITGSSNTALGLVAERGSILSYVTTNLSSTSGDAARLGGRIITGGGSTTLASASLV